MKEGKEKKLAPLQKFCSECSIPSPRIEHRKGTAYLGLSNNPDRLYVRPPQVHLHTRYATNPTPRYEAHTSFYNHQYHKWLQDLKRVSHRPNADERAWEAEQKANTEAWIVRVNDNIPATSSSTATMDGGGWFKEEAFESLFTTVKDAVNATSTGNGWQNLRQKSSYN